MAQFGGKIPPPWQTRPQTTPIQSSLLGQHPASAGPIPNQQIVIGTAPQAPQYAPVQQSMIQPPGLGGLQTIPQPSIPQAHLAQPNLPQSICSSNLAQPGQAPSIAQVSLPQPTICQGNTSLMGQPPINTQNLPAANIVSHSQLVPSQMQQITPQVTTVAYPTPRALAPPGSFSSQGTPVNLAANMNSNIPGAGIVASGPPAGSGVASGAAAQPPQKQRVFTGSITKLCADFGFVDEDVFFQTSCVKGPAPKVGDRVLVEASYNPNMPFKWNANRVQVIPGPSMASSGPSTNRTSGPPRETSRNVSFNAVPPPNFNNENQNNSGFSSRSALGPRARSPRRDRRDDLKRGPRDRPDREKEKEDNKRESRKRSRSRDRSRSPTRRRARVLPRYNVQVPKIMLQMKEANVLELRKRYSNLYVPSDVFLARPLWSDTFPAHRAFQFPRPVSFHITNKEVDPVIENTAVYDPPDINHSYAAKVMLMSVPPLEDIFRRSCALSEDPSDVKSGFVHPTRLINFLVGLKGKNETMAIGGYWSPSMDGANPDKDPNVLVQTAIRTCKALTGIDLSGCTTWYRFAEIYYRRGESTHKGRAVPARVETTVLFLPDVWNICPTKLEWDGLQLNYRRQLDRRLQTAGGIQQQQQAQQQLLQQLDQEDQEEEDGEDKEATKKDPTHWANLDPKNMKVLELRSELDARVLNSKGLKSQLIARLTKVLKVEQEREEQEKAMAEKMETDESMKKDEEERKKEEEKKKKEEEEKKKEEERKKAEERERSLLEKRYSLPEQPMILVHPSRTAKSGKFDCTTMSLSVLLDYRQEDNKEHSFEVSLFAELFNEMLMRDFAFRIFKALVEAPDKMKEEKREKEKEKDREKKEDKEEREDKKERKEEREDKDEKDERGEKKTEKKSEKEELKEEKETKKEEFEMEDEEMEEEFEEDLDEEDSKDGIKSSCERESKDKDGKDRERKKEERRESRENRREKKKKMVTVEPHLLLSFVYFDQTHTGYIVDKDLEDIINILGLNLSRAQLKKLMTKVLSRDVLYYRKLTDVSIEDRNKLPKEKESSPVLDLEQLAKGNNYLLPVFSEPSNLSPEKASRKSPRNTPKDEPVITSTGVVKYEGTLVDISKLMQQLERSEKARNDTEEKLKELQKELAVSKEEAKRSTDKSIKLNKEIKVLQINLKTTEEELKKVVEDNVVYQRALNQIKGVIRPLVAGVDMDEEETVKEDVKVKIEGSKNGYPG